MSVKTILIVRPGALGDTILTVPLVRTVKQAFADAVITFLGNRSYRDLLQQFVEFQSFDSSEWLWLFQKQEPPPQARSFDLALLVLKKPDAVRDNLLRAGTREVRATSSEPPQGIHMVTHLHKSLGFVTPEPLPCLAHLKPRRRGDLIWFHPGSGGASKCMPLSVMVPLIFTLRDLTGYRVAVTAGEEDSFLTSSPLWTTLTRSQGVVVHQGLPLMELCEQTGSASLFVGNDSGISHLAASLGIPSVVFFVRTDPRVWAPWTMGPLLRLVNVNKQDPGTLNLDQEYSEISDFLHHTFSPTM